VTDYALLQSEIIGCALISRLRKHSPASLEGQHTAYLVSDIEQLREHLGITRGKFPRLMGRRSHCYRRHPDAERTVLRGFFFAPKEIQCSIRMGSRFFRRLGKYLKVIPEQSDGHGDAYYRRMTTRLRVRLQRRSLSIWRGALQNSFSPSMMRSLPPGVRPPGGSECTTL